MRLPLRRMTDNGRSFFDRWLRREENKLQPGDVGIRIGGVILFLSMLALQASPSIPLMFKGAFAQVQLMVSILVTLLFPRRGFRVMAACNLITAVIVGVRLILLRDFASFSGIIVPFGTIATLFILSRLLQQLISRYQEVLRQQREILEARDAIVAREEELEAQNRQLTEYSQVLEENERKLAWLASYDSLTALPNRKRLMDRLGARIRSLNGEHRAHDRKDREIAVVFIDLDNFKQINDSAGHHVGDQVLNIVVTRMQKVLHEEDLLGRLGGDEFALIVNRALPDEELFRYLETIRISLEQSVEVGNYSFYITGSFGVSVYPRDGESVAELLKCADTAMYKAKEAGRNVIRCFDREMEQEIKNRMEMESLLVNAIDRNEITLVYQPQYHTADLILRGVEALIRWDSAELGSVSPGTFIPLAEAQGYILLLGKWVLQKACRDMAHLQGEMGKRFMLSVNISAVQIHHPHFVEMVQEVLAETGYPAEWLELEITESVVISSFDSVIHRLDALRKLGVGIALDDFGTGFSSLYYLQELPIDVLKIDRSFIQSLGTIDGRDQVVGGIILLSHRLGISVVAEGVETASQKQFLRAHACDVLQGFLLARPVPFSQLERQLRAEQASHPLSTVIQ